MIHKAARTNTLYSMPLPNVCIWQRVVCLLSLRSPLSSFSLSLSQLCATYLALTHIHSLALSIVFGNKNAVCMLFFITLCISSSPLSSSSCILCCVSLILSQEYVYILYFLYIYIFHTHSGHE